MEEQSESDEEYDSDDYFDVGEYLMEQQRLRSQVPAHEATGVRVAGRTAAETYEDTEFVFEWSD